MPNIDIAQIVDNIPCSRLFQLDQIRYFPLLDSTNGWLAQRTQLPGVMLCIAGHQSAGRGRRGRRWESGPGNLFISAAHVFSGSAEALSGYSLAVAVAVMRAAEGLGLRGLALKWPNDIYWQGAKTGGILVEVYRHGNEACRVITGIGINMLPTQDTGLPETWGDLRSAGFAGSFDLFVGCLIGELLRAIEDFQRQGFSAFAVEWAQHDWLQNRTVNVIEANSVIQGTARGVDAQGMLLLEMPDGKLIVCNSGEVSVRINSQTGWSQ